MNKFSLKQGITDPKICQITPDKFNYLANIFLLQQTTLNQRYLTILTSCSKMSCQKAVNFLVATLPQR